LKSEINGRGHLAQILMKLAFSGIIWYKTASRRGERKLEILHSVVSAMCVMERLFPLPAGFPYVTSRADSDRNIRATKLRLISLLASIHCASRTRFRRCLSWGFHRELIVSPFENNS
jgi:hypothetical protein